MILSNHPVSTFLIRNLFNLLQAHPEVKLESKRAYLVVPVLATPPTKTNFSKAEPKAFTPYLSSKAKIALKFSKIIRF